MRVDDGRLLYDPVPLDEVERVLVAGSLANDAILRQDGGEWTIQGYPTDAAFLVAEAKVDGLTESRRSRFDRIGEIPFSSERKLMTTLHLDAERRAVPRSSPRVRPERCSPAAPKSVSPAAFGR